MLKWSNKRESSAASQMLKLESVAELDRVQKLSTVNCQWCS